MGFIWFHVILWKMVHTPNWQSRWQSDPDGVKDVWGLVSLHQKEPRWLLHPSANGVRCQLKKMVMACHGNGSYWRRGQKERAIAIKDFYLKILCRGFKGSVHLYAGFLKWGYPKIIQSSKILYYWLYIYICVCVCIYIYMGKPMVWGTHIFAPPHMSFFGSGRRRQGKVMVRAKSRSLGKMSMASMRPAASWEDGLWRTGGFQHVSTSFNQESKRQYEYWYKSWYDRFKQHI